MGVLALAAACGLQPERQASLMQLPCEFLSFLNPVASLPFPHPVHRILFRLCIRQRFVIALQVKALAFISLALFCWCQ